MKELLSLEEENIDHVPIYCFDHLWMKLN